MIEFISKVPLSVIFYLYLSLVIFCIIITSQFFSRGDKISELPTFTNKVIFILVSCLFSITWPVALIYFGIIKKEKTSSP